MATTSQDDDVVWDSICVNPHEEYIEEGRVQGRNAGLQAGFEEGYALGCTTAMEYGMEIGFIRGAAEALVQQQQSERIQKSLEELQNALDDAKSRLDEENRVSIFKNSHIYCIAKQR